jgi:hypothetical protein
VAIELSSSQCSLDATPKRASRAAIYVTLATVVALTVGNLVVYRAWQTTETELVSAIAWSCGSSMRALTDEEQDRAEDDRQRCLAIVYQPRSVWASFLTSWDLHQSRIPSFLDVMKAMEERAHLPTRLPDMHPGFEPNKKRPPG